MKNSLSEKKRILFIEHLPSITGGQRVLLDIISGIKSKYEISVIIPRKGKLFEELRKKEIPCHIVPMGDYTRGKKTIRDILIYFFFTSFLIIKLSNLIRVIQPDLIYINGARAFAPATFAACLLRKPVIWHIHVLFRDRKTKLLLGWFGKLRVVRKIICVSEITKRQFPRLERKIVVIYNGVDTKKYYPSEELAEKIKKEFSILPKEKIVGIIGSLIPEKGHKDFIKAAKIVADKLSNVRFLIVGDAGPHEETYNNRLRQLINDLSLDKKVIFTGFRQDIPEIMNALTITSITSFEACPMVLLESMACGTPVIGSRLGGTTELIEENKNGFLYEPGNTEELAEKIIFLVQNDQEYLRMSKYARKTAEEKFNKKVFLKKIEDEIKSGLIAC